MVQKARSQLLHSQAARWHAVRLRTTRDPRPATRVETSVLSAPRHRLVRCDHHSDDDPVDDNF
eukprot:3410241-Prymnesium_polylepis.1